MKKIGIIGITGRMGEVLAQAIEKSQRYRLGTCYGRSRSSESSLDAVFKDNDYVVDFSHPELLDNVLEAVKRCPKPLLLCTTGWTVEEKQSLLQSVAERSLVVVAPNTSLGACLQRGIARQLSQLLGDEYDVDIAEKHHRYKKDSPSGTALALFGAVQESRGKKYKIYDPKAGRREKEHIGMQVERKGNLPGEHTITFSSCDEMLSIEHTAFTKELFAKGALRLIDELEENGYLLGRVYSAEDLFAKGKKP